MRVYEFAKKHELESSEILLELEKAGLAVKSHMSVLPDQALTFLENKYTKKSETLIQVQKESSQPQPKKAAPAPVAPIKPKIVPVEPVAPAPKELLLVPTVLSSVSEAIGVPFTDVILTLLKWGVLSSKNQLLNEDLIARLAAHYEIPTRRPERTKDLKDLMGEKKASIGTDNLQDRAPIVVVMGHVDHGKTTLLDFIRKTRVAAKEKGGITQHLGAYAAHTPQGNIVFLDTPGHEAFPKIRARGTRVADLAVLVVAADDGIMPQTIEAIKHAQSMEVPIIVAINKIDKADQVRVEAVRRDLAQQHNLLPEEWGGEVVFVPLSAKTGLNVDHLLEMLTLQAQMMELKTDFTGDAKGYVLETKLEKGRGAVATFIGQQGVLKLGDYFVCGNTTGRVASLVDSSGAHIKKVDPSYPVLVAGFDQLPEAGDYFQVVSKQEYLKARQSGVEKTMPARSMQSQSFINILVKTDTNSSQEALVEAIEKLNKKLEKGFAVVYSGIGNVTESDIMRAADTHSQIITLHIKTEANALALAQRLNVTISSYDIIYKLLEDLEAISERTKKAKMVSVKTGEAVVRKVFDIKGLGVIAGSYVRDGVFTRDGSVIIYRRDQKVGEGKVKSLQRDRKVVKDVHAGFECGFVIDGFTDFQVDDRVDCFVLRPEK